MEESPNLSYIIDISSGDSVFAKKFIEALKEEFEDETKGYFEHINNSEPRSAALFVNRIKQKFIILKLSESFETANYYQNQLREGDTTLDYEFRKMIQKVNVFLDGL